MFDCHIHTKYSTDSNLQIKSAIKIAKEKNMGIIITDHMDTNLLNENKFNFNTNSFFKDYGTYKNDKLLLGIEIGLTENCIEYNENLSKNNPFDYVLGSIHFVEGLDLYYEDYYKKYEKKLAYEKYLNVIYEMVKKNDYIDSLGHIDYIARYGRYSDKEIYYKEHYEIIDEIYKTIIKNDIILELNTRRFDKKESIDNLKVLYGRYKELGGKYITLGSDAHDEKSIGNYFNLAKEFAKEIDLEIVYFKERKIIITQR